MSAAPGLDPVRSRPAARRRAPLALVPPRRPVPAPAATGRTPFVVLVVSLLVAGLLGLLVLNTALAQDAFRLHTLKQESRELEDREEVLLREVEALRAPQELAARATALGMVQAGPPAFLRLEDGKVLGADAPAEVPELTAEGGADAQAPEVTAAEQVAEAGTSGEAASDEPATGEPASDEVASEEPASEEPASDEAATDEPASDEAATDEAATDGAATDGAATDEEDGR